MSRNTTTTPAHWPGAFGIYKKSKEAIMTNISVLLMLLGINILAEIIITIIVKDEVLEQTLSNLISITLGPAYVIVVLQGISKKKVELQDTLQKSLGFFLQYFLLCILIGVTLMFSILAFLIPFFFVMPRLVLAPYYLIDQKLDAMTAFKKSWGQTKGHAAKVWGIIGATLVMVLPVVTIIGIPVAIYLVIMYSASMGILYKHIVAHKKKAIATTKKHKRPAHAAKK